jgi:hypothetical protein
MVEKLGGNILYVGVHKVAEGLGSVGIYRFSQLITEFEFWDDAVRFAHLLNKAYEEGLKDGVEGVSYDWD